MAGVTLHERFKRDVQLALAFYGLLWVPEPLGVDAPATVFSEARALGHAAYLSEDIGDRRVGHSLLH